MTDPNNVLERLDAALKEHFGESQEIHVNRIRREVTRFANSEIHQNVEEEDAEVRAIVTKGKRFGVATDNRLSPEGLREALKRAAEIADHAPEDPDYPGPAGPAQVRKYEPFDEAILSFDAGRRAEVVARVNRTAAEHGLTGSGLASLTCFDVAIANTNGLRLTSRAARGAFLFLPYDARGSGYTEATFYHPDAFDSDRLAREAVDTAVRSRNPSPLPPGEYPVVLDTFAVSDLVGFIGMIGLSARAHQEKRSFLEGKIGRKVFSDRITIVDDPFSNENPGLPFDWEGTPKAPLPLFENGVYRGPVYDRYTAAKEGRVSTGHGLPPPNPWGPMPGNLIVKKGTHTLEELVAGIPRGVFVTRFHYTNVVDPRRGILTGMTRDGTFLIEDGRITKPIRNLRFTQALEPALASVSAVGDRALLTGEWFKVFAPAMRLDRFNFTSGTHF